MPSPQRPASSGSDCATIDERKRRRMESNRESARRSRMRKQKQAHDSIDQVNQLQSSNQELLARINTTTQKFVEVESSNNVLRAQIMELTNRLRSLNSVLQIMEEVSGLTLDIPEIQPWQQNHYPMHPIMTSADMFYS